MELLTEKYQEILESQKYATLSEAEKVEYAQILENQVKEDRLSESTLSADVAQFTPILVPMVRRVYPALIANELVGVQALNMPTGYLYAMTNRYTGTSANPISPVAKGQILTVADASAFVVGGDIAADTVGNGGSGAYGKVVYIEGLNILVSVESTATFITTEAVDNANPFVASATTISAVYSNQAMFTKVLKGYTGSYATSVAEALGTDMSEVGFGIDKVLVEAKSRALKGKYTIEMLQDLKAMHGLDAEKEIMDLMSQELKLEIDREIITEVNSLGAQNAVADATINSYDGRWEIEKMRMFATRISNEARTIGTLTRKGAGNTMLVSPRVATILENIGTFTLAPVKSGIDSVISGVNPSVGTFDGRYKVITDNFATADYATVLYKGASNKDAGLFFAPYQGAAFQKVTDPVTGQPAVILKTRYGIVRNPMNPETYVRTFNVNTANLSF
jgi:hypothetical protein